MLMLRTSVSPSYRYAGMAELVDALDSGSSKRNLVEVQVLLPAPGIPVIGRVF